MTVLRAVGNARRSGRPWPVMAERRERRRPRAGGGGRRWRVLRWRRPRRHGVECLPDPVRWVLGAHRRGLAGSRPADQGGRGVGVRRAGDASGIDAADGTSPRPPASAREVAPEGTGDRLSCRDRLRPKRRRDHTPLSQDLQHGQQPLQRAAPMTHQSLPGRHELPQPLTSQISRAHPMHLKPATQVAQVNHVLGHGDRRVATPGQPLPVSVGKRPQRSGRQNLTTLPVGLPIPPLSDDRKDKMGQALRVMPAIPAAHRHDQPKRARSA